MPILSSLADGHERGRRELIEAVKSAFSPTVEEANQLIGSGRPLIDSRIGWGLTYAAQAGLVSRPARARFQITERGLAVLRNPPTEVSDNYLRQFPEYVDFKNRSRPANETEALASTATSTLTPEERIDAAVGEINASLASELLEQILRQPATFFERLVIDLLKKMGYGASDENLARAVGKSGDGGIDGIIYEDRLGLDVIYVQAKRYSDATVGREALQAFVGSLAGRHATKGVFITTSQFSQGATAFVNTVSYRVALIDGPRLAELMIAHNVGVRAERTIDIKRLDADYFDLSS